MAGESNLKKPWLLKKGKVISSRRLWLARIVAGVIGLAIIFGSPYPSDTAGILGSLTGRMLGVVMFLGIFYWLLSRDGTDNELESLDSDEKSESTDECLNCGMNLPPMVSECPHCGWTSDNVESEPAN